MTSDLAEPPVSLPRVRPRLSNLANGPTMHCGICSALLVGTVATSAQLCSRAGVYGGGRVDAGELLCRGARVSWRVGWRVACGGGLDGGGGGVDGADYGGGGGGCD